MSKTKERQEVVIIGGGIAGVAAASRVAKLPEVSYVHVLEKGNYEDDGSRVPQKNHTHVLSSGALKTLREVTPDIDDRFQERGAPELVWGGTNVEVDLRNGTLTQTHPFLTNYSVRRPTTEAILREEAMKNKNIIFHQGVEVSGLQVDNDRVEGVNVRKPRSSGSDAETGIFSADVAIVATGSGPHAWISWLTENGYEEPQKETVDADLTYFSATFKDIQMTTDLYAIAESVEQPRAMVIARVDGGNFLVTMFVYRHKGKPPKTQEEYLALAEEISPRGQELLKTGELLGDIHMRAHCKSERFKIKELPDNLYPVGDAPVTFNPRYGQGMSVAIFEAKLLQNFLSKGKDAQAFLKSLKGLTNTSWLIATSGDYAQMRHVNDPSAPPLNKFGEAVQGYFRTVQAAAGHNVAAQEALFKISNYEAGPFAFFAPQVISAAAGEVWKSRK